MSQITHTISGELWRALRWDTTISRDGEGVWGYGETPAVDLEVERMVHDALARKQGFGQTYTMTGSRAAWEAIKGYADDRAYIESNGNGDFDRSAGKRFDTQGQRIEAALA